MFPHSGRPLKPVLVNENPLRSEQLDSVVPGVRDDDLSVGVGGHVPGVIELSVAAALLAEGEQESAVDLEYLDAVVVLISDNHSVLVVDGYACWTVKLAGAGALRAELVREGAVRVEHLRKDGSGFVVKS